MTASPNRPKLLDRQPLTLYAAARASPPTNNGLLQRVIERDLQAKCNFQVSRASASAMSALASLGVPVCRDERRSALRPSPERSGIFMGFPESVLQRVFVWSHASASLFLTISI